MTISTQPFDEIPHAFKCLSPPIFNILRLHIGKTNSKKFWDEHQISIWDEHLGRTYECTYVRTEKATYRGGCPT